MRIIASTLVALVTFATLTRPGGEPIYLNPHEIVGVTPPSSSKLFAPGVRCLVHTSDRKLFAVLESCITVHKRIADKRGR